MTDDRATPAILGLDLGATDVKAGLVNLDGRLLAIARAGYGLEVGHGPGWAEQDPGAWWSAVVGAVRGPAPDRAGRHRRDRGRRPWADARRGRRSRRGHPSRDHVPRYPRRRGGSRAGRRDRHPRLGAGAPARRALAGTARARDRCPNTLVPDHLGMARVPADRRGRRSPRARPGGPGPVGRRRGDRPSHRPATPERDHGRRRRDADRDRGRCARPAGRDPGRRRHERRVRELPRGRAPGAGRRLRPGWVRRRVRRVLARAGRGRRAPSSPPHRWPGCTASGRRWPRPVAPSTGSATRSSVATSRPSDCSPRRPPRLPAPTGSCSCRTWPASARRSGTRRRRACSRA